MRKTKPRGEQQRINDDIRARHIKRQKKKRKRRILFRTISLVLLVTITAGSVMFLTPWFNINEITVNGNEQVSADAIIAQGEIYYTANIFKISTSAAREKISVMPYIKSVEVNRRLPAAIDINVIESHVAAYFAHGGGYVTIDEDGKVLENTTTQPEGVMQILGCEIQEFVPGHKVRVDLDEKFDIIILYADEFAKSGILDKVSSLDVTNIVDIKFRFDNRLDVFCGDSINLNRKMLMFNEVVFNQLSPNARGEIDLRIDGKGHYRP